MRADLSHAGGHRGYVAEIDGLRAVAVLAVMLYHLAPGVLPGGFSGVDVFFVISGYVVSSSLARDAGKPFLSFLQQFYARRIARILPALLICLLATAVATTLFIPNAWLSDTTRHTARYAVFGLSNIVLVRRSDGYFSPRAELNPFTHTWTLGVEEQFYLLFPVVFFLWMKFKGRPGPARWIANGLLSVLLVLSLAYSAITTTGSPEKAFYYLPSRFWELASGALLFQLQSAGKACFGGPRAAGGAFLLGLALIVVAFVLPDQRPFPIPWALLPVCGAWLLIAAVTSDGGARLALAGWMSSTGPVYLGKLSYSLYLWHWPVFVVFRWTLGLDTPARIAMAIATAAALAVASYHLVEEPIRRAPAVRSRPQWRVVVGGFAGMAACWVLATIVFAAHTKIGLSVTKDERAWYPKAWPAKSPQDNCRAEESVREASGVRVATLRRVSCDEAPSRPLRVFVVGDSHAAAYGTLLNALVEERGTETVLYIRPGCAYLDLFQPTRPDCARFVEESTADVIRRATPGDIVFLASLRVARLGDQLGAFPAPETAANLGASDGEDPVRVRALQEARELLGRFDRAGLRVIVEAPKPVFRSPAFRCSDWFNAMNSACAGGLTMDREFLLKHRQAVMDGYAKLSADYPKTRVWDPFPLLCPDPVCKAVEGRGPLFFDGDHISALGNRILYPSFVDLLDKMASEHAAGGKR